MFLYTTKYFSTPVYWSRLLHSSLLKSISVYWRWGDYCYDLYLNGLPKPHVFIVGFFSRWMDLGRVILAEEHDNWISPLTDSVLPECGWWEAPPCVWEAVTNRLIIWMECEGQDEREACCLLPALLWTVSSLLPICHDTLHCSRQPPVESKLLQTDVNLFTFNSECQVYIPAIRKQLTQLSISIPSKALEKFTISIQLKIRQRKNISSQLGIKKKKETSFVC